MISVPNFLTSIRIVFIPIVISLFYLHHKIGYYIAAGLFIGACITDYLDGYVARTYHQTTTLGKFLDPMADKLLICSTLLLLVGFDHITDFSLIPAIIILCREILISGLREFLADTHIYLPVTQLAKWKTTLQMISLTILIVAKPAHWPDIFQYCGIILLWSSAFLSSMTGYHYIRQSIRSMSELNEKST